MDTIEVFPDAQISNNGPISAEFLDLGMDRFAGACRYVHCLPYGYNSDRDDPLILFKEGMGTCTTKHAAVATLAQELTLPVVKNTCIYGMTEAIVTGAGEILKEYDLPYVPMTHCFLSCGSFRVDLTEGNWNGKNQPIDQFLHTEPVKPDISEKDEYLLYRKALQEHILFRKELSGVDIKRILQAREKGIRLLRSKISIADRIHMKIRSNPPEPVVRTLLSDSKLQSADITAAHLKHFFCCGKQRDIDGVVGMEIYGEAGLLRSLAVASSRRGLGLGTRLVEHAECYAKSKGVGSVFLLTHTAEAFFLRLGYTRLPRDEAPEAIRATREFSDICPLSCAFMVKHL